MPATRWTGARSQAPGSRTCRSASVGSARRPEPMPRAVVTGGAGFLRSHMCERLLAGADRAVLGHAADGSRGQPGRMRVRPRVRVERTDVTRFITVEGAVDAVVHLASPASPRDYLDHPIHTLKVGALGTLNAVGLAKASGKVPAGVHLGGLRRSAGEPAARDLWGAATRSAHVASTTRRNDSPRRRRWRTTASTPSRCRSRGT